LVGIETPILPFCWAAAGVASIAAAIRMPTKSSARWIADGQGLVQALKDKGYTADLQYAEDSGLRRRERRTTSWFLPNPRILGARGCR
jgi:ABC-type xylose transport system substrate-binding protein